MEVVRQAVNGAIIAKAILTRLQSSCLHISSHIHISSQIFTSRLHSSCLHFTFSQSKAREIRPAKNPSQMFQMKQITMDCAQSRPRVQSIHNYLGKLIFELTKIHVSIKILTKIRASMKIVQLTKIHVSMKMLVPGSAPSLHWAVRLPPPRRRCNHASVKRTALLHLYICHTWYMICVKCKWFNHKIYFITLLGYRSPVQYSYRHGRHGGGTQLFEGAHLTGGNKRFCHESSKCRDYVLFVGQIIKYALWIIIGFGPMGPLQTKIVTQMCPFKFLGFKSN